jgi:hypothetical protein
MPQIIITEVLKMAKKYVKKAWKKHMREQCEQFRISVPENANRKQLKATLEAFYEDAAAVHVEDEVTLRWTDKPTAEYSICFSISGVYEIRAESEEAARKWLEENAADYYNPDFGNISDIDDVKIHKVYKVVER